MSTSVKNNLKLLLKREKFKHTLGGYSKNRKTEYNLPKATSKQLRDIRRKMHQERKIWWVKVIAITVILFLALLIALFSNFENISYYLQY